MLAIVLRAVAAYYGIFGGIAWLAVKRGIPRAEARLREAKQLRSTLYD